ncbi:putative phage abortive infection protein [Agrobacterium pusense]|uniref:putative phage abortive infection protein n=1 Tax=Agrobacterium pusense TaxID=648995 RepID=UPI00385162C5
MIVIAVLVAFVISIVVAVWLLWAIYSVQIAHWALGSIFIPAQAGPWGDSFGAFNALFGALGFAAVLGTLLVQGRSLRMQQQDQHRQRFDANFFELLSLMRELRSNIRFQYTKEYAEKKSLKVLKDDDPQVYIRGAVSELRYRLEPQNSTDPFPSLEDVEKIYDEVIDVRFGSRFGPYFRVVYTILRRIDEDRILTAEEKIRYGNLLRGQLSTYDVALICLNSLSPVSGNLKQYLSKYRIPRYLRAGKFKTFLLHYFEKECFTSRD